MTLSGVPEGARKAAVVAAAKGVLSGVEEVNLVNAAAVAKARGIALSDSVREDASGYANLLTVAVETPKGARSVSATLFGDQHGRIVSLDGLSLEFKPQGTMLVLSNRDVPGVIGRIGTLLGQKGVNIVDFALARGSGGRAAAVVRVDPPAGGIGPDLMSALSRLEGIESARLVSFG